MKTTELMIGNWVRCTDPTPFKIEAISIIDDSEFVTGNDGFDVDIADLQPIPLTPEILEKNGFVNIYRGRYRFDDNKGLIIEISTINGVIKWVRVSKYDSDDIENTLAHFTSYEIKYLHELQNALKLCKINKEIII